MNSRNNLMAGLVVLASSLFLVAGSASAHGTGPAGTVTTKSTCVVHTLPSFIAQGELGVAATVADVVEVECNPEIYGTGSLIKITAGQLATRCKSVSWYVPNPYRVVHGALSVTVPVDADGNATVALLAGPDCQAGDSMINAHMLEEPFETFTSSFAVLPPVTTKPGVYPLPASQVEDAFSSSVATIIQTEFADGSEKHVRIASPELFARCRFGPHIEWIGMNGAETAGEEVRGIELDNDGNAFVIAIGNESCAEGASLIEADLENKPFTTFQEDFTIEAPRPTEF